MSPKVSYSLCQCEHCVRAPCFRRGAMAAQDSSRVFLLEEEIRSLTEELVQCQVNAQVFMPGYVDGFVGTLFTRQCAACIHGIWLGSLTTSLC